MTCLECGHEESDHATRQPWRWRTLCEYPNCDCLDFIRFVPLTLADEDKITQQLIDKRMLGA